MKGLNKKPSSPFKFNPSWLKDESYNNMFKTTWRSGYVDQGRDKSFSFMENMKCMKKETIEWGKRNKDKEEVELKQIGEELVLLESPKEDGYEIEVNMDRIKQLESN